MDLGSESKHEIVSNILSKFEIGHIVSHCLQVMHKVNTRVGNDDNRKFQLYHTVLPRTFSIPLLAVWENIVADFPLQANTVAAFHDQLKHFFAANSTESDRHKLIEFVRKASKPVTLSVQVFFYRLRELNDQAAWLPGNANVLTAAQIDQAFFDGMPMSWRNRYSNAGRTLQHDNHATLLCFFRLQEHTVEKSQRDNNEKQRQGRSKRQREAAANRFNDKAKGKDEDDKNKKQPRRYGGKQEHTTKKSQRNNNKKQHQGRSKRQREVAANQFNDKAKGKDEDGNKKRPRCNGGRNGDKKKGEAKITPDSKCPIHPQGNHTWGECYSNAANKDKPKPPANKKAKKNTTAEKTNGNALQASTPEEGSIASIMTVNSDDAPIEHAINDQPYGNGSYKSDIATLCNQLNKGLGTPSELLAEFKAKQAPFLAELKTKLAKQGK